MKSFLEQLQALAEARCADGRGLALLFVDCGVVARIDGVWGYAVGDAARERFGALLGEVRRPQDLLGNLGRDEFALVLDAAHSEGVALLAAEKVLRALDAPIWAGDDEIYARPTVGIALCPGQGDNPVTLLRHAKTACEAARDRPDRFAIYAEAQDRPEAELLRYENRLRAAIGQQALELVFEPQIEFRTGLVAGAECLLRWGDGDPGVVPAEKAIAAAESAGRLNEFTLWVLNGALRSCRTIRDSAGLDLRVGFNLSAKSLRQREVAEFVASSLRTWNLRPSRLVLEIADTAILERSEKARETLADLKELGVRLAIDDAGTGYPSLAFLATLPFHEMKINLAAIGDMLRVPQRLSIVHSLIDLAHELKLETVAEGVADQAAAARLKELGCDYIQGPHVGPPLDLEGFVKFFGE